MNSAKEDKCWLRRLSVKENRELIKEQFRVTVRMLDSRSVLCGSSAFVYMERVSHVKEKKNDNNN